MMFRNALLLSLLTVVLSIGAYVSDAGAVSPSAGPVGAGNSGSFANLAEILTPAVVNISTTQKMVGEESGPIMPDMELPPGSPFEDFFEQFMDRTAPHMQMMPQSSLGSGFIIDAEKGYIITNNHVVRDADNVRVTFHDDETVHAEIIGRDDKTDIAVLQVKTDKKLMQVHFGDSDKMRVGDWVVAIGNPFGLGGTVTAGIVSARQRDINSGPYDDFIQTDASINRGNSGGPMFNLAGEVIGINTAIFSPSGGSVGIGFAIPANLAKPVIDQIIKYGHTRRGWLGVRIQGVTEEIAESLGLKGVKGALVATVTKDSPASKADVEAGDIILEFNGQKVNEMRELPRIVAETEIGTTAKMVLWRDGQEKTVSVQIGELEKAEEEGLLEASGFGDNIPAAKGTEIASIGLTVKGLNDAVRREFGLPRDVEGVIVTEVETSSEAARKGLTIGDLIIEINQSAVKTPDEVNKAVEQAKKDNRKSVLLLVNGGNDTRFVALRLDESKKDKAEAEEPAQETEGTEE